MIKTAHSTTEPAPSTTSQRWGPLSGRARPGHQHHPGEVRNIIPLRTCLQIKDGCALAGGAEAGHTGPHDNHVHIGYGGRVGLGGWLAGAAMTGRGRSGSWPTRSGEEPRMIVLDVFLTHWWRRKRVGSQGGSSTGGRGGGEVRGGAR